MTAPHPGTTNIAGDSARVGLQTETVHGSVYIYMTGDDPTAPEKFELGVRYLDGGMSGLARKTIDGAVKSGASGSRVCFYWMLSQVSGRTWRELSDEERRLLRDPSPLFGAITEPKPEDPWDRAVRIVRDLVEAVEQPSGSFSEVLAGLENLDGPQRDNVLRHLEMYLDGPIENELWKLAVARAEQDHKKDDRHGRVPLFFEADPAAPRERPTRPIEIFTTSVLSGVAALAALALGTKDVIDTLARAGSAAALVTCCLALTASCIGGRYALDWRFRTLRRRQKDAEYRNSPIRRHRPPLDGFADKVDKTFDHFFATNRLPDTARGEWMKQTAAIRRAMRHEIVEVYRDSRIPIEEISWLIKHRARRTRDRWQDGSLWDYRRELATPLPQRAAAILLIAGGGTAWSSAITKAAQSDRLATIGAALLTAGGISLTARAVSQIYLEFRRSRADRVDARRAKREDDRAYRRWRDELEERRPEDTEMAAWLECDRALLLDAALKVHRLLPSDVLSYGFIHERADPAGRARVLRGPWRYSRYTIMVFLLTDRGVRQLTAELNFAQGSFHDWQEVEYRFDVIASVRMSRKDGGERSFKLRLVDQDEISFEVTGSAGHPLPNETADSISAAALDAAGLHHTLHLLQGVAAEGREWLLDGTRHASHRLDSLTEETSVPAG